MDDTQLLRYSRQIMLPQIDANGQQTLLDSTVLIVGMGGLGSPAAMYLASAGIGHLILADFDDVELSNLQRQIIHRTQDIGKAKVDSAFLTIKDLNPDIVVTRYKNKLDAASLDELVPQVDLVLDGCDNFATRFSVNEACVKHHKPLVSGAAIRFEGQVSVFPNNGDFPCYRCLYRDEGEEDLRCSENGVLAPVTGVIGSIQAIEAIKMLTHVGEPLCGYLLVVDSLNMDFRKIKLKKDPSCPVCSAPQTPR